MKRYVLTAGLACALALPAIGAAQSSAQPPANQPTSKPQTPKPEATKPRPAPAGAQSSSASGLSTADQSFAKEAAIGGMAEVDLGKLAASKATTVDVPADALMARGPGSMTNSRKRTGSFLSLAPL